VENKLISLSFVESAINSLSGVWLLEQLWAPGMTAFLLIGSEIV
jgi:hypothetical protein